MVISLQFVFAVISVLLYGITPNMLKEFPNGNLNAVRIIIEIKGERIDEIHKLPFCRGKAIRKRSLTTVI